MITEIVLTLSSITSICGFVYCYLKRKYKKEQKPLLDMFEDLANKNTSEIQYEKIIKNNI